jgi:hypothetical protein
MERLRQSTPNESEEQPQRTLPQRGESITDGLCRGRARPACESPLHEERDADQPPNLDSD